MQIAKKKKQENFLRLKSKEPGSVCVITGRPDFDLKENLKTKQFVEKNKKFTFELNKFLNQTQTRLALQISKEKEADSLMI